MIYATFCEFVSSNNKCFDVKKIDSGNISPKNILTYETLTIILDHHFLLTYPNLPFPTHPTYPLAYLPYVTFLSTLTYLPTYLPNLLSCPVNQANL